VLTKEDSASNELLYGRTGYLFSLLFIQKQIKENSMTWIPEAINQIARLILSEGKKIKINSPLMYEWHSQTYLAGAHGVSGIIYELLDVPELLKDDMVTKDIKETINFIISLAFESGNYPTRVNGTKEDLVQWCHGAPSIMMLYCKAFKIFNERRYLKAAVDANKVIWERGLLKKGLSLCHGVAGNGYGFLKLYQLTEENKYLQEALHFCEWSWLETGKKTITIPDNAYSLFEGIAGTVCFMEDILTLNSECQFPCFDVGL